MIDRYEMPHVRADECPHAGVGKACGPCRELFQRGPFTCPRCYKVVTLRLDGRIRPHTNGAPESPGASFSQRCPASGASYEKEAQ